MKQFIIIGGCLSLFLSGCTINLESSTVKELNSSVADLRTRTQRLESHAEARDQDMQTVGQKFQQIDAQIKALSNRAAPQPTPGMTPVPGK